MSSTSEVKDQVARLIAFSVDRLLCVGGIPEPDASCCIANSCSLCSFLESTAFAGTRKDVPHLGLLPNAPQRDEPGAANR